MLSNPILVGLASGVASAALSTALASGSMFSLFLFLFAPLPIFIAALGWRHSAGLIGAVVGTLLLLTLVGFDTARGYALSVGFPAWWLAYLAQLGQPTDPTQPEKGLVWYPVGRLVVWCAVIGSALVLMSIVLYAGSVDDYRAALRETFEAFLRAETNTPAGSTITIPGGGDADRLVNLAILVLPPLAAAVWTAVAVVNLWVGGRVVRASGRLARAWPDLASVTLPGLSLMALLGGIVGSALPGLFGFAAGVIAASFTVVFATLGLAVIHSVTRGTTGRTLMLSATYLLLAVQTWIVLVIAAIGILDLLFGIRARVAAARSSSKP